MGFEDIVIFSEDCWLQYSRSIVSSESVSGVALNSQLFLASTFILSLSEGLQLGTIMLEEIVGVNQGWALWQFLTEHQVTQAT